MDIPDIPIRVLRAVYQNIGGNWELDTPNISTKLLTRITSMDRRELFDRFLEWEGIIGYTDIIIEIYRKLWDIELDDLRA